MTSINNLINDANSTINGINQGLSSVNQTLNALTGSQSSGGNGLPYNNVPTNLDAQMKRNIITWFIPQFGIVKMYVNPNAITYRDKKLITKVKTKGGFTLQYWGEDLTTIDISGTTGSSGIEGINVLHEMYRAEQLAFDPIGLMLDANNTGNDISHNLINGAVNLGAPALQSVSPGILGMSSPTNTLSAQNIPSLAQLAFTVEMYYGGAVYRGYFDTMTVNERSDNFLMEYQMTFIATQKRGYRTNYFPFSRSPSAPSSFASDNPASNVNSFSGNIIRGI